jgi:hypothetical protein
MKIKDLTVGQLIRNRKSGKTYRVERVNLANTTEEIETIRARGGCYVRHDYADIRQMRGTLGTWGPIRTVNNDNLVNWE